MCSCLQEAPPHKHGQHVQHAQDGQPQASALQGHTPQGAREPQPRRPGSPDARQQQGAHPHSHIAAFLAELGGGGKRGRDDAQEPGGRGRRSRGRDSESESSSSGDSGGPLGELWGTLFCQCKLPVGTLSFNSLIGLHGR